MDETNNSISTMAARVKVSEKTIGGTSSNGDKSWRWGTLQGMWVQGTSNKACAILVLGPGDDSRPKGEHEMVNKGNVVCLVGV